MASPSPGLRFIQTATSTNTIWSSISQDDFRQHLVTLERQTNAVPIDCLTATIDIECESVGSPHCLPLRSEKQIADDLAYVAAVSEGAQSVAAVCLEQLSRPSRNNEAEATLIVKVAGMDIMDDHVKAMMSRVALVLQDVSRDATEGCSSERCVTSNAIFKLIIQQHRQKLLGRMRSDKWTKPKYLERTHKKSLAKDFANLVHRVQHVYPKKAERSTREVISAHLTRLAKAYEDFECSRGDDLEQDLQSLVKVTYAACQIPEIKAYASRLESVNSTPQIAAAIKTLRQLEKIGAYWRVARDLVATAGRFPAVFRRVQLQYIMPYASVPTDITHESWAGKCHVHAEVQLVVEYALAQQTSTLSTHSHPRTIGISKYLCYLCYLFLRYHGGFEALSTHGRLYDQWTVPDLAEYAASTRQRFATVLDEMDQHVQRQIEETKRTVWRPEPMTSRQNLLSDTRETEAVEAKEAVEESLAMLNLKG